MNSARFSKKFRIYKCKDFQRVFRQGKRFRQAHMFARCVENGLGYQRLGISIGKKFGKANQRVRFKRMIRESFRQSIWRNRVGIDIVIMPNNANKTCMWKIIEEEVNEIMQHCVSSRKKFSDGLMDKKSETTQ